MIRFLLPLVVTYLEERKFYKQARFGYNCYRHGLDLKCIEPDLFILGHRSSRWNFHGLLT